MRCCLKHALQSTVALALISGLIFVQAAAGPPQAEGPRVAIYSPRASFVTPVVVRSGTESVDLLAALRPLGEVASERSEGRVRLRFERREASFREASEQAEVAGRTLLLQGPFLLERGQYLVPLASLPVLLSSLTGLEPDWRPQARRLFLGGVKTQWTAELRREPGGPRLVFSFSSPVSPAITSEPGKLRMVFAQDPVASKRSLFEFGAGLMSRATFLERNGAAELVIYSPAALVATFHDGGRTVIVGPAPVLRGQVARLWPGSDFVVMIDAAHGGRERGADLGAGVLEKNITLALARRLRRQLEQRQVATAMVRDSDSLVSLDERAAMANTAQASLYISLHASRDGSGVRVYTALLPAAEEGSDDADLFQPWSRAQARSLPQSEIAARTVTAELAGRRLSASWQPAPLRPLNNLAGAALAIEVAAAEPSTLSSNAFQQRVAEALAAALEAARPHLEQKP